MDNLIKELYKKKLQYNCFFRVLKRGNKSDLLLIFLGASNYLIVNNYWGVVACGTRKYSYDDNELFYSYEIINRSAISLGTLQSLIIKHERKDCNLYCSIHFDEVKESIR